MAAHTASPGPKSVPKRTELATARPRRGLSAGRHPFSIDALANRIQKRIGRVPTIVEAADEVREVHPAEEQDVPAAFSLPGQLERAKGSCAESTLTYEIEHLLTLRMRHAATLALRFDHALLVDGVVYGNGARIEQVHRHERLWPRWVDGPMVENVSLPSSVVGNRYFGHFITDDACAAYLAEELAPAHFTANTEERSAHSLRYLDLFGVPLRELHTARLRNAWLVQDFAMTAHKRERYRRLRAKVAELPGSRSGHGVFFRRRGAGVPRGLMNEPELEERLEREGFEIIDVTTEDVDTILRRCKGAKIVTGIEGSAPMHGLLAMQEGGALVMLMPPYRFSSCMKGHANALGIEFGFMIGEGGPDQFTLSVDELMRTLDMAWTLIEKAPRPSTPDPAATPASAMLRK